MRARQAERLLRRYVLPRFPEWAVRNNLLFASPVGHLLRGVTLGSASFNVQAFYLQIFVQPTYVPDTAIALMFGRRIQRKGDRWQVENGQEQEVGERLASAIAEDGLPWFEQHGTVEKLAAYDLGPTYPGGPGGSTHVLESVAGARVLAGDYAGAAAPLDEAARMLETTEFPTDWKREQLSRVRSLRSLLPHDPAAATAELERRRDGTLKSLGLADHA